MRRYLVKLISELFWRPGLLLEVQKLTQSGLNGVAERDFCLTNLPSSRLIKVYLRGENRLQNDHFISKKGPVEKKKNL